MRCISFLLYLLVCSALASAQSFDRLILRPRAQGDGTYLPAVLKFCGSDGWPTSDPECVGLQAPEIVERYDLFWPPAGPVLPSCIDVTPTGQMGFTACGAGLIFLSTSDAIFPPSDPASWSRTQAGPSILAAFIEIHAEVNDHAQWTFVVPVGFTNQPTLVVWGESGGSADEFEASIRCIQPNNNEDWTNGPFDSANTGTWISPGISGLNQMVIPLLNNDGMEADDICQLDLTKSVGSGISLYYQLEIR